MKKLLILCTVILVTVMVLGLLPVHGEAELYDRVLRLHVLANSDSEEDQSVKLKVRDEVLAYVSEVGKDCRNREEIIALLGEHLDAVRAVAEDVVARNGQE